MRRVQTHRSYINILNPKLKLSASIQNIGQPVYHRGSVLRKRLDNQVIREQKQSE